MVSIGSSLGFYAGVHIGATRCHITARTNLQDQFPIETVVVEFERNASGRGVFSTDFDQLLTALDDLMEQFGTIRGIGVGIVGRVNQHRSHIVMSGNLPHWIGENFVDALNERYGCDVILGNNVEIAAIAEKLDPQGIANSETCRGLPFVMIDWSEGIGAARVSSKLIQSRYGAGVNCLASESGHLPVDPTSMVCCIGCEGDPGHFEAMCGATHLLNRFDVENLDDITEEQWEPVFHHLIVGVANTLRSLQTTRVIITGTVIVGNAALGKLRVIERLQAHFDSDAFEHPKFFLSHFASEASQDGAHLILLSSEAAA